MAAVDISVPAGAQQVDLDPKVLAYKLPADIKWRDPADKVGTNQAVLFGDPAKPGLYIVLNNVDACRDRQVASGVICH